MSESVEQQTGENETPKNSGPVEFTLSKPITAYGKQVATLTLRRPTGKDLLTVGNPVIFTPQTDPPEVRHDYPRVVAMVARLANVPSTSLEGLEPTDLVGLAWIISPFFMPL